MHSLRPVAHDGAASVRWDEAVAEVGEHVIPLSVADMDLAGPPEVAAVLVERARRGAYGYTYVPDGYTGTVAGWFARRHGWEIDPGHILPVGRVVEAVPALLHELTEPGAGIVVPTPSYGPVTGCIEPNGRRLVPVPLREQNGRWTYDLPALEAALSDAAALVLTGPHNPTGRVWTAQELTDLAAVVKRTDVLVLSDEVHADLLLPGHRHVPFATVSPDAAARTLAFTSPGKTFNMAGLESANLVVTDPGLRRRARAAFDRAGFHNPRYFAVAATTAAYTHGGPWLDALLGLLARHVDLLRDHLTAHVPGVRLVEPEGTHLAWLDCRGWTTDEAEIVRATHAAGLTLSPGSGFGPGHAGFARINLAVPTDLLTEALDRLARARAGSLPTPEERTDA